MNEETDIQRIERKIDFLTTVMVGDEKFRQKGVLERIEENETYREKDKKFKYYVAGFFGAFVMFKDWIKDLIF